MPQENTLYTNASIYDILHRPGSADEVTSLEKIAARFSPHADRRWLEPACGTARLLRVAAGRGKRVAGFDLEPGMIDYAQALLKAQGLASRGQLFTADMTDFASQLRAPADFAFNTINTIRHLESDEAMLDHFAEIPRGMRPGSIYAVGLSISLYGCEQPTEDVWSGTRSGTSVTQTVQYLPPTPSERCETVISHLEIDRRGEPDSQTSTYALRSYSRDEWLGLLDRSPLEHVATVDEDANDLEPPEMGYAIWILQTPTA